MKSVKYLIPYSKGNLEHHIKTSGIVESVQF